MSIGREVATRAFVAFVIMLGLLFLARAAHAAGWVEAHMSGSDARVSVAEDGASRFEIAFTYRVVAGTLHDASLSGLHAQSVEPVAEVKSEDGVQTTTAAVALEEDRVKIVFDGKGIKRGTWIVRLRGAVKLAPAPDGALFRLSWTTPVTPEGVDGARVVFDLPAGPTEPRALRGDGDQDAAGIVATLRRSPERDELELVRPHVARGEAANWSARVDPKAFPLVTHPALRPPPASPPPHASRSPWLLAAMAAVVGILFALFIRRKRATSMIPFAPIFAGGALASAVWFELDRKVTFAGLCVGLAIVFSTFRMRAREAHPARGVWRPIELALPNRDPFDAFRAFGASMALASVLALVIIARILVRCDDLAPTWTAMNAMALVPLFFTGTTPTQLDRAALILCSLRERLSDLHITSWGRGPREGGEPVELRLSVMPHTPMPGLVAIEIAMGWDRSGIAWAPSLELLVRARSESSAHQRLLGKNGPRSEPGRTPDERVFRHRDAGEALVRDLVGLLEERRKGSSPVKNDRRAPKRVRIAA